MEETTITPHDNLWEKFDQLVRKRKIMKPKPMKKNDFSYRQEDIRMVISTKLQ